MIDESLKELLENTNKEINHTSQYVKRLLNVMDKDVELTTKELMEKLNMKSRISFRDNYLKPALESGLIKMTIPEKPTSKNQMYYKI